MVKKKKKKSVVLKRKRVLRPKHARKIAPKRKKATPKPSGSFRKTRTSLKKSKKSAAAKSRKPIVSRKTKVRTPDKINTKNEERPKKKRRGKGARVYRAPQRGKRQSGIRPLIKIKVVGVGGGGGNAITRMRRNFAVRGVEFIAVNTDLQDLESCDAHKKIHIGRIVTKGLGAGMNPDLGQQAAEEDRSKIVEALRDTDMIFITSGFGGGTGTGAAPVVADVARELDILTMAVITKPFAFEGANRMKIAEDGIAKIKDRVDTLLVVPNDRIFGIIDKDTSVLRAFEKIDDILRSAVQGIAEIISSSGLVNVDFADIKSVTGGAGMAVIGVGVASGADRAIKAMNQAINSPLLDISIDGARSVLFGVAGGRDLKMSELNEAAKIITESVDPGARIIFGAYYDRRLKPGHLKITLIATGFNGMLFKNEPSSLTLFGDDMDLLDDGAKKSSDFGGKPSGKAVSMPIDDSEPEISDEEVLDTPTFLRRRKKFR